MIWMLLALAPFFLWGGILLLPWRPWATREYLNASDVVGPEPLPDITVLIPARNEAEVIGRTLEGIRAQGPGMGIIVVDDQSTDQTTREAMAWDGVRVIPGEPLPPQWSGKVWALEQGLRHVRSGWVLLLDADIVLAPGILQALLHHARTHDVDFLSLMARLRMTHFWEKWLMPAFVYFFKLLYPFALANSPPSKVAAAAGGCILVRTDALRTSGGFSPIKDALIDDCALARQIKRAGFRTWTGLSHSVQSLRPYQGLKDIAHMVARTAFYQLHHSTMLLFLLTAMMILMFWVPMAGLAFPSVWPKLIALSALGIMMITYVPTLRFYGLSMGWALSLPLIGGLYLLMTWMSAIQFWQGTGARWKGRAYGV